MLMKLQTKKQATSVSVKIPRTYCTLQLDYICSILEKKPAIILCERKTIKWAAKVAIKESYCQGKKKRVRKKKWSPNFGLWACAKTKNTLLNYIHGKLCLNVGNSILVILMLTDLKMVDVNRQICVAFISKELKIKQQLRSQITPLLPVVQLTLDNIVFLF